MENTKASYYNQDLQKILDKYVQESKYGEFKPILDEIMQRRAYEFEFTNDRMEIEAQKLVENLEQIYFKRDYEYSNKKGQTTVGGFSYKDKKISLNIDEINAIVLNLCNEGIKDGKSKLEIALEVQKAYWGIITHEVYHAINANDLNNIGLMHMGNKVYPDGRYLNEIFTEVAALRTCGNKEVKNINQGYNKTDGYEALTFLLGMMSNACGVSQKELLSHGLSDKSELVKFIKSKALTGETEIYQDVIDAEYNQIEGVIDSLAVNLYFDDKNNFNIENSYLLGFALQGMYDLADTVTLLSTPTNLTPEELGKTYYRYHKMNIIAENAAKALSSNTGILSKEEQPKLELKIKELEEHSKKIVTNLYSVYKDSKEDGNATAKRYKVNAAINDSLEDVYTYSEKNEERCKKYLSTTSDDKEKEMLDEFCQEESFFKYVQNIRIDDFDRGINWNIAPSINLNTIIENALKKVYDESLKKAVEKNPEAGKLFATGDEIIANVSKGIDMFCPKVKTPIITKKESDNENRKLDNTNEKNSSISKVKNKDENDNEER